MERVTVDEAAKMLGISKQAVRVLMDQRVLKIGIVIGGKRKRYLIFKEKLYEMGGKEPVYEKN
jgi:hypothetical protein